MPRKRKMDREKLDNVVSTKLYYYDLNRLKAYIENGKKVFGKNYSKSVVAREALIRLLNTPPFWKIKSEDWKCPIYEQVMECPIYKKVKEKPPKRRRFER